MLSYKELVDEMESFYLEFGPDKARSFVQGEIYALGCGYLENNELDMAEEENEKLYRKYSTVYVKNKD
jgi:hypothetical protein